MDIANFYEIVGGLVFADALPFQLAYTFFGGSAYDWWKRLQSWVRKFREWADPLAFANFEKIAIDFHRHKMELTDRSAGRRINNMDEITLLGKSDTKCKFEFLHDLFDQSDKSLKHVSHRRQINMNYALVIFLGLLGFGLKDDELIIKLFSSISIIIIMSIFCFWDRRLHKSSHVLLATRDTFGILISQMINNPGQDITFSRYRDDSGKEAEWFSFQPIIYYLLILCGFLSALGFLYL